MTCYGSLKLILSNVYNLYFEQNYIIYTFAGRTLHYKSTFAKAVVRSIRILALGFSNCNAWVDLCSTFVDI